MEANTITTKQLHILRHSLGLDDTGRGREYRNYYCTGPDCDGWSDVQVLIGEGLMHDCGPVAMWGGSHGITVTDAGKAIARKQDPMPNITRGRRRWLAFLHADCGLTFGEWLKTDWAKEVR